MRRMLQVGVEGDPFDEHWENTDCKEAGCIPVKRPNLYVSKPQQIEAVQWDGNPDEGYDAIITAFQGNVRVVYTKAAGLLLRAGKYGVSGFVHVPVGHWIARKAGDRTDYWPIEPDHFAVTYEAVDG